MPPSPCKKIIVSPFLVSLWEKVISLHAQMEISTPVNQS